MAKTTAQIDALLREIDDPALREKLKTAIRGASGDRRLGLVWEDHLPDATALPGVRVTTANKVVLTEEGVWRVQGLDPAAEAKRRALNIDRKKKDRIPDPTTDPRADGIDTTTVFDVRRVTGTGAGRTLTVQERYRPSNSDSGRVEKLVSDVPAVETVAVVEYQDTIYPGLDVIERITQDGLEPSSERPAHLLIEGENLQALEMLRYTHGERVDCIYIDPPYNTGNESWIYNDDYVEKTDVFRQSKWLSFMHHRLLLAKKLLKSTGIIIVAIGDDEHHRLRMLMDHVFRPQNFIADVVWQGGLKNDSHYVSNGADYMLIYARNESILEGKGVRWREEKRGLDLCKRAAVRIWSQYGPDAMAAAREYKAWLRANKKSLDAGVSRYNEIDADGRLINTDGDLGWPGGGGPRYEILHPVTRKPVSIPDGGWRFKKEEMLREIEKGNIAFGLTEKKIPRKKRFLEDLEDQVAPSVFSSVRTRGSSHLYETKRDTGVFRDKRFPNPKDHEVLMRWLRLVAPKNAIILDFFAGSGSTGEAVMRLNSEDGGTRQCILVTNNEMSRGDVARLRRDGLRPGEEDYEAHGVCRHVTVPRLATVLTGVRPDGSRYNDSVPPVVEEDGTETGQELVSARLTYELQDRVISGNAAARVAALFWLRSGGVGPVMPIPSPFEHGAVNVGANYIIGRGVVATAKAALEHPICEHIYLVTDSQGEMASLGRKMRDRGRDTVPIQVYEHYLRGYEINGPARQMED